MRRKKIKKKLVAFGLATAMALSVITVPYTGGGYVQAAEASVLYEKATAATAEGVDFSELEAESWADADKVVFAYDESVADVTATEKFNVTADVTLDETAYAALTGENYFKVQSVVKLGEDWTWTDSSDIKTMNADSFTKDGDVYKATVEIAYKDVTPGEVKGIYFAMVGVGFAGDVTFSNVKMEEAVAETKTLLYEKATAATAEGVDFSELEAESWADADKVVFAYDESVADVTATEKFNVTADVTLDETAYAALTGENYFKVQSVVKLGEDWTWTDSSDIKTMNADSFTKDGDVYKATVEIAYKDVTPGEVKGIYFAMVGVGFAGDVTFSNVKMEGITTGEVVLPEKEPTVVADFESGIDGWEPESGYAYHGGDATATKADKKATIAWDEDAKALKVHVDYSLDSTSGWSEAKVKFYSEEGLDVSAYNLINYDMIYPAAFDGKVKTKVYATNADVEAPIINKDVSVTSEDYAEGLKKATVTIRFSPSTDKINNLTLSIVGSNTDFVGDVLLDNVTLSQYDASADFVDITEEVQAAGDKAILTGMPEEVSLADVDASAKTKALYAYLQGLDAADQVLFGHQNDTHKCVGTGEGVYSDTKDITGSISGLVGIDSLALTGAELGLKDVDAAIAEAVKIGKAAAEEGAILTLSTHMPNMSNAKIIATPDAERPYDFNACDFNESKDLTNNCAQEVMPGGKYNAQFTAYLDIIADYALGLGDIPVLFRPFHENTGGWFWWGSATTDKETYRAMFRYTKDYLSSKGVHNFIYVYSPNGPLTSEAGYLDRYPGDDCVDVLGFDYYDDYNNYPASYSPAFMTNLAKSCEVVSSLAKKKGKVAAISETGVRVMKADKSDNEGILVKGNPIKDQEWYGKVNDVAKKNGIPYFLLWANFGDTNFYVPYKYNDTKGHELINEFIKFYNEDSSIFANGTNFYDEAVEKDVTNTNTSETEKATGYFVNMFSKMIITEPMTIKASVKNAKESVKFVLKNGEKTETIVAVKNTNTGYYEGDVTDKILTALGQTDIGTAALVVDDEELVSLSFISFGKEKDVLPKNIIENFELYYGDNDYLAGAFSENSGAGADSSMILDETNKASGSYGGAFTYTFNTEGAEVYTGQQKSLDEADYTGYNALKLWIKPDGKQQKLVLQLVSNGEDFEVYPNTFFKESTDATYLTVPFASFKGKAGGDIDPANITKFAVWCNSIGAQELESSIYMDDIQFVKLTQEELENVNEQGFIVGNKSDTDSAVEKVIEAINAIKDVKYDDASKKAIDAARKAYDALTADQKKLVSDETLKKLTDAEKSYADQKKAAEDAAAKATEADKKKAADVTAAINAITDVQYNDASKAAIEAARKAYDALTADQKKLVSADTLKKLTDAEADYEQKKAEVESLEPVGKAFDDTASKAKFVVTKSEVGNCEVAYKGTANKKATKITIPNTVTKDDIVYKVTSISANALKNNKKVTKVTMGSNMASIGANAFSGCSKLTTVSIGKNVTTIGKQAFNGCKKLKTVSLGKKVTSIGERAFYKCSNITKITIPANVKSIGKEAFSGCKKLKTITIKTKKLTSKSVAKKAFKGVPSKVTVKVPKAKLKAYKKLLKSKGLSSKAKIKK